jgi:phage major head subunit gpT-like protein
MAGERANFGDTLAPELAVVYFDRYEAEPETMPDIFNVKTSDRSDEQESAVSGFSLLQQTAELGPLDYEDPNQMYKTTYTHLKYTKGFKVSRELWEDDQHNTIKNMPGALGKAAKRTQEFWAASVFNNGFDTTKTSYGDAKPLFSTSHPRADGGTAQSNASSTGLTLTEPNLETIRVAMRKVLDDKGQRIVTKPTDLIVPIDLEKTANILVNSTMRPGTANNDYNVYKGTFKVTGWEYLTSTTAWYLMDRRTSLLTWYWRIRPEFKQDNSFDSDAALYKTRIRFSYGWSDWRGLHGSKGDGGAYSS